MSIWLGEGGEGTLGDTALKHMASRKPFRVEDISSRRLWDKHQAKAVLAVCENPYWRRMWIIQEVVLTRTATIYYGSRDANWGAFGYLISDAQDVVRQDKTRHTPHLLAFLASPATVVAGTKMNWGSKPQPWLTLLRVFQKQEATEVRDKV